MIDHAKYDKFDTCDLLDKILECTTPHDILYQIQGNMDEDEFRELLMDIADGVCSDEDLNYNEEEEND